jgi:hypothetical protein
MGDIEYLIRCICGVPKNRNLEKKDDRFEKLEKCSDPYRKDLQQVYGLGVYERREERRQNTSPIVLKIWVFRTHKKVW